MSDEYGEPPVTENKIFPEAVARFYEYEEDFFSRISTLLQNPYDEEAVNAFNQSSVDTQDAFVDVVIAIASDDELSLEERAKSIATWFFTAEQSRLDFLRKLAPEADYEEGEANYEHIVENVTDLFNAGLDPTEIGYELGNNYAMSLTVDMESLKDEVSESTDQADEDRPTNKDKAVHLAKDIGIHAAEVGKLAAGIALGTLLAQKALNRFGR